VEILLILKLGRVFVKRMISRYKENTQAIDYLMCVSGMVAFPFLSS
jgi:hypothetical protein